MTNKRFGLNNVAAELLPSEILVSRMVFDMRTRKPRTASRIL